MKRNRRARSVFGLSIFSLTLVLECFSLGLGIGRAFAAPGDIDVNFSMNATTDSRVNELVVQPDGRILIGGFFTNVAGLARSRLARLNSDGTLDVGFNSELTGSGAVSALLLQPDGLIVVGTADAQLTRLSCEGKSDSNFNHTVQGGDSRIEVLARQPDGKLLVGGNFKRVDGYLCNGIVRLRPDGGVDTAFDTSIGFSLNAGVIGTVSSIAIQPDGKILLSGSSLTRLNANGTLDEEFGAEPGLGYTKRVFLGNEGRIYVCGGPLADGELRRGIVRLLPNGRLDKTFVARFRSRPEIQELTLNAVAVQADGRIIVGGLVNSWSNGWLGSVYSPLIRLDPDGTEDTTFGGNFLNGYFYWYILSVALEPGGGLLVGGQFDTPGKNIARLDVKNAVPSSPAIIQQPSDVSVSEGQFASISVWVRSFDRPFYQWQMNGGDLPGATNPVLSFANVDANNAGKYRVITWNSIGAVTSAVASLTVTQAQAAPGAVDISFVPGFGPNGAVQRILPLPNGKTIIVGEFTHVDGVPRKGLARLQIDGSVDSSFAPPHAIDGFSGGRLAPSRAFLEPDGRVVLQAPGNPFAGDVVKVVRLNLDGSVDPTFTPTNVVKKSMVGIQRNGDLLFYDGTWLSRLRPDGTWDPTFQARIPLAAGGPMQSVELRFVLEQSDGRLVAVGDFAGGQGLVRVNLDGTVDAYGSQGGSVSAAALSPDDKVLLGWPSGPRVIRLNHDLSLDVSFSAELSEVPQIGYGYVSSLAVDEGGRVLVAGGFTATETNQRASVARLLSSGRFDTSFQPLTVNPFDYYSIWTQFPVLAISSQKVLVGGAFTEVNGFSRNGICRASAGATSPQSITLSGPTLEKGSFSVSLRTVAGKRYVLEHADSITASEWSSLPGVTGDGTFQSLRDPDPSVAHRFYKVRIE